MIINWRMKVVSGLLIVVGLLFSVAATAGAISSIRKTALPFDQVGNTGRSGQGFVPLIVLQTESVGQGAAPTLPPRAPDMMNETQSPQWTEIPTIQSTSAVPTSPPFTGLAPAAVEAAPPAAGPGPIWIPDRIVIPAIKLDAPVVPATFRDFWFQAQLYGQWVAPNSFDVGRLTTSAPLGVVGNTVLIGHHNDYGEVFGHLVDLHVGDVIQVYSGDKEFVYEIALKMILPERDQPLEVRLKNAQWIASSQDERLTLVTCWPQDNNTHRLVIVATPVN